MAVRTRQYRICATALGLSVGFIAVKQLTGEMSAILRVAQHMIDIAGGDPVKGGNVLGLGSPMAVGLASRGFARCRLGDALVGGKTSTRPAN